MRTEVRVERWIDWSTYTPKDVEEQILTEHYHSSKPAKVGEELIAAEIEMTNGHGTLTYRWNDGAAMVWQLDAYRKDDGKLWIRYTGSDGST